MIKFIIEGQRADGVWIELFKNQRSYKTRPIANRVKGMMSRRLDCELRVSEVEIETIEEKKDKEIESLKRDLKWCLSTIENAEEMMDEFDKEIDDGETISCVKDLRIKHGILNDSVKT